MAKTSTGPHSSSFDQPHVLVEGQPVYRVAAPLVLVTGVFFALFLLVAPSAPSDRWYAALALGSGLAVSASLFRRGRCYAVAQGAQLTTRIWFQSSIDLTRVQSIRVWAFPAFGRMRLTMSVQDDTGRRIRFSNQTPPGHDKVWRLVKAHSRTACMGRWSRWWFEYETDAE